MAKKKIKNKKPSEIWKKYKIQDNKIIRKRACPKCGIPNYLAEHKDRLYCGHCHYLEMKSKT
jgi:small subunit ribosomal protein S27Ae